MNILYAIYIHVHPCLPPPSFRFRFRFHYDGGSLRIPFFFKFEYKQMHELNKILRCTLLSSYTTR